MKYLKVWTSFRDLLHPLEFDEIGRLFLMMLEYAETGEEPTEFIGNEAFLFPVAKQQIDLAAEKVETLRQNGSKGGLAKSRNKQTEANDSKGYQNIANGSKRKQSVAYKEKECNVKECNVKECNETELISDADAHMIQTEQNRVLDAAEDAGFQKSNSVRAGLLRLYAEHGLDRMLSGIDSCVKHSATTLAYLEAVLNGKPKKAKVTDFSQRDYSEVQDEIMDDLAKEMEDFKKRGAC